MKDRIWIKQKKTKKTNRCIYGKESLIFQCYEAKTVIWTYQWKKIERDCLLVWKPQNDDSLISPNFLEFVHSNLLFYQWNLFFDRSYTCHWTEQHYSLSKRKKPSAKHSANHFQCLRMIMDYAKSWRRPVRIRMHEIKQKFKKYETADLNCAIKKLASFLTSFVRSKAESFIALLCWAQLNKRKVLLKKLKKILNVIIVLSIVIIIIILIK